MTLQCSIWPGAIMPHPNQRVCQPRNRRRAYVVGADHLGGQADIQAETPATARERLPFRAKHPVDGSALRARPARPRRASVDDGRGARGLGVG